MKLSTRNLLLTAATLLIFLGFSTAEDRVKTQMLKPGQVTKIKTSLNHISTLVLPEPIISAAIGSEQIHIEWHDNRVLVQPMKNGVSTNLFVWTANNVAMYEILPAGDEEAMSYMVEQMLPALPTPTDPDPEEVLIQTDGVLSNAIANYRNIQSDRLATGNRLLGRYTKDDRCKECLHLRIKRVTEDPHNYYVYVVTENKASHPYRVTDAAVTALRPSFSEDVPARYMNQQISVDALRKMGRFAPEPLQTHGSTLHGPRDLAPGEKAEWVIGFSKPSRTPAVYQFTLQDDDSHPVTATVVF